MKNINILILGTTGYIGSHIKHYLTRKNIFNVFELNRDLADINELQKMSFDFIVICIGNGNARVSKIDAKSNLISEINFIKKIENFSYKKCIYISSALIASMQNNYTKNKIIIEKYLENNFYNLSILRLVRVVGNIPDGSIGDDFKNKLNLFTLLFLFSKKLINSVNVDNSFLKVKREYLSINTFSKYITNIDNLQRLESKTYNFGSESQISGIELLEKASKVFNFDLDKLHYVDNFYKSSEISTRDISLENSNIKNIYKEYNSRLDFLNKKSK